MKKADAYDLARSYVLRNIGLVQADQPTITRARAEHVVLQEAIARYGCALGPTSTRKLRRELRAARVTTRAS